MPFDLREIYECHKHFASKSLRYYLDNVVINSSPEPRAWKLIREPWQDELLAPKLPAFERLAGIRDDPVAVDSFFDILARGHDKSSLEGRLASGLLMCSRRPIDGYIVAADSDQAAMLKDAMQEEAKLNPWVDLKFTRWGVEGPNGQVQIVPADAGGAYGARGNLFIFDEMCNWDKPVCKRVYDAVMSGTRKRDPRVVAIISNAGYYDSWQEAVWKYVQKNKNWSTFYREGHLASWMSEEKVNELRATLSSQAEADRLFGNKWISRGDGQGYLTYDEAKACVNPDLFYRIRRAPGVRGYVAAIDYGPKTDWTVCCVGHKDDSGRCYVDRMDVLPHPTPPSAVRNWIREIQKGFDPSLWLVDPYQMLSEMEWMQGQHLPVEEYGARGGKGNLQIAETLRNLILSGGVQWYPNCGDKLEEQLSRLVTVKKPYGFRIDHESTQHDDQAVCLGMLLVGLTQS